MALQAKKASETHAVSTIIVLPNDTNTIGNMMGGRLLHHLDVVGAIAAHRLCNRVVVTAAVNNVSFNQPIKLADIVTLEAKVSRSFNTSMEVCIDVYVENHANGKKTKCNEAIYTFVAVDQMGSPIGVPEVTPETELEKERFHAALRRRQLSLILAGKMKPEDAGELKKLFIK
jgi:acyl-CoA hydrolase